MDFIEDLTLVYESQWLKINHSKKHSLFFQKWKETTTLTNKRFKNEMLAYTDKYSDYTPSFSLWEQTNFTLNLTPKDFVWIERNVNIPCKDLGNIRCAFLVGQDVLAHIGVLDAFEKVESCIDVKHFCEVKNAIEWLFGVKVSNSKQTTEQLTINFDHKKDINKRVFSIEIDDNNIIHMLRSIQDLKKNQEFALGNLDRFQSLTNRELEVFKLYNLGNNLKLISEQLFISELTVRTHWKKIKKKLQIQTIQDINDYANAFMK